ncbi:MAG TPA: hypothetical protein VNO50_17695 [Pyrinomonadaceae bacterium]|nr:hypothetical protein [Pyrinomonadaceae bacterium]
MDNKTIEAAAYDTDKAELPNYLRSYEEYFRPLLGKEIKLLKLGIYRGGSLLLWRDEGWLTRVRFELGVHVGK